MKHTTEIEKLKTENQALKDKLTETAKELRGMIDEVNRMMKNKISHLDSEPPDYVDYQTVYEAVKMVNERNTQKMWNTNTNTP